MQAGAHACRYILGRLDIVTLHVDDAHRHALVFGDLCNQLQLGELAARHFQVDLIRSKIEERREHGRISSRPDRARLVIAEAQVSRQTALAAHGFHCTVEDIDEALRVLAVRVAAH